MTAIAVATSVDSPDTRRITEQVSNKLARENAVNLLGMEW